MAVLEDEGYIAQPHTSAGRIPTDKGYRLFVDKLAGVKPLSSPERRAIQNFLDGAVDLDDVVGRTVRLLAQLTRQVAVVQYPSLTRSTVRHVELLVAGPAAADAGADHGHRPGRAAHDRLPGAVRRDRRSPTCGPGSTAGWSAAASPTCRRWCRTCRSPSTRTTGGTVSTVLATLLETLVEETEERLMIGGTANLTRFGHDFPLTIRPVLEALEEQVVLLKLLGEAKDSGMTVRIGHENDHEGLNSTSVVSVGYGSGDEAVAKLGVVGPTRMDYPGTMGAVRAVARYVGQILAES